MDEEIFTVDCHWRKGDQQEGYRCASPLFGPVAPIDHDHCLRCPRPGHFDKNPELKKILQQKYSKPRYGLVPGGIEPVRVWRVQLGEYCYQGSLIEHGGRMLLAYRRNWENGDVAIADLGPADTVWSTWSGQQDIIPTADTLAWVNHQKAMHGREDPRLFHFQGQLHCSFNGLVSLNGVLRSTMIVALLSPHPEFGFQAQHPQYFAEEAFSPGYYRGSSSALTQIEKNWQFFEHDRQLYCVYSIEPHVILRMDGVLATEVAHTTVKLSWDWGYLRGGAPPVRVGEEFYHFFHGQTRKNGITIYTAGVYTFDARPPFAVRRFASVPVLIPPPDEFTPQRPGDLQVIFPCGAVLKGGCWWLSYGHNDYDCRIAEFHASDIEKILKPVQRSSEAVHLPPAARTMAQQPPMKGGADTISVPAAISVVSAVQKPPAQTQVQRVEDRRKKR